MGRLQFADWPVVQASIGSADVGVGNPAAGSGNDVRGAALLEAETGEGGDGGDGDSDDDLPGVV